MVRFRSVTCQRRSSDWSQWAQTDDGFELAELDWRLRGAGDLLGTRQSGSNQMQRLELVSPELVELAQREARYPL